MKQMLISTLCQKMLSYLLKTCKLHIVLNDSSQELFIFLTFPLQSFPNCSVASLFTSLGLNFRPFICSDEPEGFEFHINIWQWMQTIISPSAWTSSDRHCVVNLPDSATQMKDLCAEVGIIDCKNL